MADESPANGTPLEGARRRASTACPSACPAERATTPASTTPSPQRRAGQFTGRRRRRAFPEEHANTVLCGDSRSLPLPDNCVQLVRPTSYNASKDYDEDLSLKEYLTLLHDVFAEAAPSPRGPDGGQRRQFGAQAVHSALLDINIIAKSAS